MGVRMVDPGNVVHASDHGSIAILVQAQPASVLFTLPAHTLDDVREAQKRGAVEVIAYDRDNRNALSTGTLATIDNVIDQATASYKLKATFANDDEKLWPGEFVNARLLVDTHQQCLDGARRRHPARAQRAVRLDRRREQQGRAEAGQGRPVGRRHDHRHLRHRRRRARHHRRTIQAAQGRAGQHRRQAAAGRRRRPHEPVGTVHPPADRHHAADGGGRLRRHRRLPFLPVAPLPQVDFPTIQITATWQGASAETIATSVAAPLERQFAQIPGITQMTSQSALGAATIVIQFDLNRNIDSAAQDVQAAITVASKQLPQAMTTPPSYKKVNPADSPILLLTLRSDTIPLVTVDEYADLFLAQQISQVPGVAQVSIFGDRTPSIRIQIDPAKLANSGLTLEDIRGDAGEFHHQQRQGHAQHRQDQLHHRHQRPDHRGRAVQRRRSSPIATARRSACATSARRCPIRSTATSPPIRTTRTASSSRCSSSPAPTSSTPSTRSRRRLPQLTARIPPAIEVRTLLDRTTTIRASVADVEFTLGLTIALVVMVILLFLRNFWATLIPSVTVPLALTGSAAAMYLLNFSLDNLSLMALTIAVGFVVDDAIVVVENIYRHIEEGEAPFQAAIKGSREIGFTVLSISCSLIAVFIPLLLMGGIIGRLFREFALTVTASIAVSALVSLTLAPMMCARFMQRAPEQHGRVYRFIERGFDALVSFYRRTLDVALRRQRDHHHGVLRHHGADRGHGDRDSRRASSRSRTSGMISAFMEAAQDTSPEEMMRLMQKVGAVILEDPDVAGLGTFTGSTGGANTANTGRGFIVLKPRDERELTSSQIIDRLRPQAREDRGRQRCSCRRRRTSPSAAASPARASSTRCRIPISTS